MIFMRDYCLSLCLGVRRRAVGIWFWRPYWNNRRLFQSPFGWSLRGTYKTIYRPLFDCFEAIITFFCNIIFFIDFLLYKNSAEIIFCTNRTNKWKKVATAGNQIFFLIAFSKATFSLLINFSSSSFYFNYFWH